MSAPALALRGVSVELGGRPVLRDATLEVARGELVGLLGPNGAGKTTLLRTALGLLRPARGRIEVDGDATRRRRGAIGYVPQRHEFAWEFPLSVEEVVMSGRSGALGLLRRPRVEDWRLVDEALERVRMSALRERPVGQLSGGQRQRVLVARALALGSPLLLLDEPFSGLDLPTQELLTDLFVALAREDRAVLMSTHDLAAAIDGCDRLALIDGTIVASGAPRELAGERELWRRVFGIGERSPLLRLLEAVA
ncbi:MULTISPECIES: anchored repeat-type ABC transporter ATP-binding subunit [unclassified Conexibacter]|uniref:anchored repeat-type ABC transporter ATP-binding subunit n=1 Tax=unclassified Conexibacter TaxID=2627773 RepID=UPI00271F71E2|nr:MULTISPECIES: anchored repeat-type ABC transporter ATP-binding subunit [unclassified Conexibacter]MDO8186853.1 anchored repeat-type ABC transporter ATP-binding subunit [Conexibacter sp. CPCC 205706]MDO8200835.1 anchored repeat-type ABC transporter ATP-binding subunit [Conexibacter sp. CPCC 205762]